MAELVSFSILSKESNTLNVRVSMIHPDESFINSSPNFALQIIMEHYEKIQSDPIWKYKWSSYTDNKSIQDDLLLKMRQRTIIITKAEYQQIEENETSDYQGKKLLSKGIENEQYYITLDTEYEEFCKEANKHIEKVEVLQVEDFPHWLDRVETWLEYGNSHQEAYSKFEDVPNPKYYLRITVNPQSDFLLHHIEEQYHWQSTAYNFSTFAKDFLETKEAVYETLAYDSNIIPPSDNILEKWWSDLSENWKKVIHANYHMQKMATFSNIKHHFDRGGSTFRRFGMIYSETLLDGLMISPLNIKDLRNISKMKWLYATGLELTNLAPIGILKGLKFLELGSNPLESIEILEELKDLEYLNLNIRESAKNNSITLQNLTKIRNLSFNFSSQEELEVITKMPNLHTFYSELNFELDASVFKGLPQLKEIAGYCLSIKEGGQEILNTLHEKGVNIDFEIVNKK